MTRLQKIFASFAIFFGLIFGVGFFLPDNWSVERSVFIQASPEKIYPFVANLQSGWTEWSLLNEEDKEGEYVYSGPEEGVGAFRTWKSKKMGNGWQRITKADPKTGISYDLEMEKRHFLIHGNIKFVEKNGGTEVIWIDTGNVDGSLFLRYLVRAMDMMMGEVFERSLKNLKQKVDLSDKISH